MEAEPINALNWIGEEFERIAVEDKYRNRVKAGLRQEWLWGIEKKKIYQQHRTEDRGTQGMRSQSGNIKLQKQVQ
jgi:beta-galactosidase GanA